jgi:acetyl esterase/lipase
MMMTKGLAVVFASLLISGFITTGPSVAAETFSAKDWLSRLVADRNVGAIRSEAYGAHPRQKLDIYQPKSPCPDGPIVVFWYGGSWTSGAKGTYAFVGSALAARGITTVVPDYRVYPEVRFPDFVTDAASAYQWTVRSLAQRPGASPRPVFLMGHSAGAHTAALLAFDAAYLANTNQKPAGFIGLAGPYAFDPTSWNSTKAIFATAKTADSARPVVFVKRGAPPSLLLHGEDDTTVKPFNYRDLSTALKAVGTPVETALYPGIGHVGLVLSLAGPLRWRAPTLDATVAFVERHAGGAKRCTTN